MKLLTLVFCFLSAVISLEARGGGGNHHSGGGGNHVAGPGAGRSHGGGVHINNVNVHVGGHGGGHYGGRGGGRWHGRYWGYDGPYWCSWFVTDLAIASAIAANSYARLSDREVSRALDDARAQLRDEKLDNDQLRRQVRDLIAALEKEENRRRR